MAHRVAHGLAHGPGPRFCPHPDLVAKEVVIIHGHCMMMTMTTMAMTIQSMMMGIQLLRGDEIVNKYFLGSSGLYVWQMNPLRQRVCWMIKPEVERLYREVNTQQ